MSCQVGAIKQGDLRLSFIKLEEIWDIQGLIVCLLQRYLLLCWQTARRSHDSTKCFTSPGPVDCVDLPSDQFICAIGNNLYHLIIIAVSLPTVVALSSCLTHHCSTHEFCGESSTGAGCYCRAGFASKYHSSNTLGTDKKTLYTIHQCASDWSETFSLFCFDES